MTTGSSGVDPDDAPGGGRRPPIARNDEFADFFRLHRRGVEAFVRSRLNHQSTHVDDVCADVFVVALQQFDRIGALTDSAARSWLLRVAELRCLREHRSHARFERAAGRFARGLDAAYEAFDDQHASVLDGDAALAADRVREVIAVLPESYQVVLRVDATEGMTGRRMAAELDATYAAARLRLMRAKRVFREEYVRRFGPAGSDL